MLALSKPKLVCEHKGCKREGRPLAHERVRILSVKGDETGERTVAIHFFRCLLFWPRRRHLHHEVTGPLGEKVEVLGRPGRYRYIDSTTGELIETERKRRYKPGHVTTPYSSSSIVRFCNREGCTRKGWKMRHTAVQLNVKGTQERVIVDVFKCEISRPSKVLHKEARGRNGEAVKLLRLHAGEYELTDPKTGKVIVTQKRTHRGDHISTAGKKRLSRMKADWWKKHPEKRETARNRMRDRRTAELRELATLRSQRKPKAPIGRPPEESGMTKARLREAEDLTRIMNEFIARNGTKRGSLQFAAKKVYPRIALSAAYDRADKTLNAYRKIIRKKVLTP